jgi:tRNA pseudouridine38-40 synthase
MRYFLQCSYHGYQFSGFQEQPNAITIQSLVQQALHTVLRQPISLTGSSRTDAQVNAHQNFFHFDVEPISSLSQLHYQLNAILPPQIAVESIKPVSLNAHARFSATSRTYHYYIHQFKNPFLHHRSYYFPYPINPERLQQAATIISQQTNFLAFSKTHTQVNNHNCNILHSQWHQPTTGVLHYQVQANRFLRGMVKALVATSLQYAIQKISDQSFLQLFQASQAAQANFTAPGYALYLHQVHYPESIYQVAS